MTTQHAVAKQTAIDWAKSLFEYDTVIIDFETTGRGNAEIVQIGVLDAQGNVLMDQLVKPGKSIPAEVTDIHGITDEMVADAPTFPEVAAAFEALIAGKLAVAYNCGYEEKIIAGECKRHNMPLIEPARWSCAMKAYASYYGQWHKKRRSYIWQSLTNACKQQGVHVENAHNAIGDCRMTLALINKMMAG